MVAVVPWRRALLLLLLLGTLATTSVQAIYPDGHFDHVTKITSAEHLDSLIDETLEAGQTLLQAPSWNDATKAFAGNKDVRFADINLSEVPIRGAPYNPGAGGWPTIRYFNKETGKEGAPYTKKTEKAMCEELGDIDNMMAYIEEAGGTSLCSLDGTGCDEKSLKYLEKVKQKSKSELEAQLKRLESMEADSMKKELKDWLKTRKRLLNRLIADAHDEL